MTTKKRLSTNDLRSMIGNLTFGRALKSERESRNMARSDFGKILGITIQSLADLENERRIPSPARAVKNCAGPKGALRVLGTISYARSTQ
jgi:DNA-binding XRE family transcriptional regulator